MSDETQAGVSEVRAGQRIAKVMARAGVCSRRDAEAWIAEGRVAVNGEVLKSPAFNVSETDDVRVDGKKLAAPERTRLFLFHKPRGLVTTARDPEGRQTVFAVLPPDLPRLVAIGRLDINTEGLLLLTNDGGLARVLELPSTGWLRRYRVRAHGTIDQAALDRLSEGVTIDGIDYLGVEAKLDREQGANAWLTLGLREGKNREIKKILEHLGLAVNRLIRVSFGPFELGDLPEGEVMEVRTRVLRDQLGVKLAKEANVDFDAPQIAAIESPPEGRPGERPRTRSGAARESWAQTSDAGPTGSWSARGRESVRSGAPRHGARPRPRPRPSAGANMSRHCARKSPLTPRQRANASSAAQPTTARGGQSRSSACPGPAKRRAHAPRPKRGRNAADVRTLASAADVRSGLAAAPVGATPSGPSEGRAAGGRERPARPDQKERGRRPERSNAARAEGGPRERRFDRPQRSGMAIAEMRPPRTHNAGDPTRERKFDRPQGRTRPPKPARAADRRDPDARSARAARAPLRSSRNEAGRRSPRASVPERGMASSRRANANLTGLRAGRVPQPARADRRDRTTRAVARAPTSSQTPRRRA